MMKIIESYVVIVQEMPTVMYLLENGKYAIWTPTTQVHQPRMYELEIISENDAKLAFKNKLYHDGGIEKVRI